MAGFSRFRHADGTYALNQHYRDRLGQRDPQNVNDVDLDLTGTQVFIHLSFTGSVLS